MVVGKAVGLLVLIAGTIFTRSAIKTLGDQFHAIGVSTYSPVIPGTTLQSSRVADQAET